MTRTFLIATGLLVAALAVGVNAQRTGGAGTGAAAPAGRGGAPAGNAANGRKHFVSYGCYQCHGYEGQGSTSTGPRLGPRPLPWAQLEKYVRAPTNQMPPYTTKVLSESDLADIYAFLQNQPQPTDVDRIPLLK